MYNFKFKHDPRDISYHVERGSLDIAGHVGKRKSANAINVMTWIPPKIQHPKPVPNPQSIERRQRQVLAKDTFVSLVYGQAWVDGKVALIHASGNNLYVLYVFGVGEFESYESIYIDNILTTEPSKGLIAKGGAVVGTYYGTSSQTADSTLASLISGYNDTLEGIAYLVIRLPASYTSVPRCSVVAKTKKVYNPKTSTIEFSTNPALWLADFITNLGEDYGIGESINWSSVETVQDACAATMSNGEVRRGGGYFLLDRQAGTQQVLDELRNLSGCWVTKDGDEYKLIPDRPVASTAKTFDESNILSLDKLEKRGLLKVPNAIQVVFTDTSKTPWADYRIWEMTSAAEAGTEAFRPQTVTLRGIVHASEAKREAVERLNRYISDLEIEFVVFDEGLELQVGDVVEVTHYIGLSNKKFQLVAEPVPVGYGRWKLFGVEYDPAIFSDEVITTPTYSDTNLPDAYTVPDVNSLSVTEIVGQKDDGTIISKISASWDAVTWPFLEGYEVKIETGATLIYRQVVGNNDTDFTSPPVEELKTYTVSVRAFSTLVSGAWTSASITPQGKYWVPADVQIFYGFEAGGEVHLWWERPDDPDIWRFEVRYYQTTQTWDDGTVVDQVDSLTLTTRQVPEGTWRFGIKAIDSVRQYSENAKEIDIEVTMDTDAFRLAPQDLEPDNGSTSMSHMRVAVVDPANNNAVVGWQDIYVTAGDTPWNSKFTGPINGNANPILSYFDNAGDSELQTRSRDYTQDYSGNFIVRRTIEALSGSFTEAQQLMADGGASYADYALSAKEKARYQRYLAKTSGHGNVAMVTLPVQGHLSVIPRTESGESTSSASGPTTISLKNTYSTCVDINIIPQGTTAKSATYDNIDLSSGPQTFDVYVFDASGNQIASDFRWTWKGA